MAWTQADLDNLDAAIATGARIVRYQDREVTYQSTQSMLNVRAMIAQALAGRDGVQMYRADWDPGLDHKAGDTVEAEESSW